MMNSFQTGGLQRSQCLYEEAQKYAPGGVQSNVRLHMKPFPLFFSHSNGSRLWDVDGNEYIDYALGMGPVILGHNAKEVNESMIRALSQGQLYAGQHEDELELARTLCHLIPCAESVRFSMSGSESVQAALRLARAFTGRDKVIKFEGHYHGWFDSVQVSVHPDPKRMGPRIHPESVPGTKGQPKLSYQDTVVSPWNDLEALTRIVEQHQDQLAAIVMEPILCNTAVIAPKAGYLEGVRNLCNRAGLVLIFDEVITGFRVGLTGAHGLFGVMPDLAIFAKALANGFPISCVVGRRDMMEMFARGVLHAGTYNGNRLSCAAALATLKILQQDDGDAYRKIHSVGSALMSGLRQLVNEVGLPLHVQGFPGVFYTTFTTQPLVEDYRSYLDCDLDIQSTFVERLRSKGVNLTGRGTWFLSTAHTMQDVEITLEAAREVLKSLVPNSAVQN